MVTPIYAHPLLLKVSVFLDCTSEKVGPGGGGGVHIYIYIYVSLYIYIPGIYCPGQASGGIWLRVKIWGSCTTQFSVL